MTDRVYIPHLREGSDDCWDDGAGTHIIWRGWDFGPDDPHSPEPCYCAVWTGTADREVLAHFGTSGSPSPTDD